MQYLINSKGREEAIAAEIIGPDGLTPGQGPDPDPGPGPGRANPMNLRKDIGCMWQVVLKVSFITKIYSL